MLRLPFWVFSLVSFFFLFFFLKFFFGILLAFTQLHFFFFQFDRLPSNLDEFVFLLDTLLSFLMYFHFSWRDWTHFFFWLMKCVFFFPFPHLPHLIRFFSWWFFIFAYSSKLEWSFMEFHVSRVFWWISIFSQLDLSLFLFFWLKSFLAWWPTLFSHNLILFQNIISPWWAFFLSSLMEWTIHFFEELSFLNLMNSSLVSLSSLKTLPSGVESIRSSLPHLEI